MTPRHYTDPLGCRLRALERNLFKLRGLQIVLVIFYAEELKRKALDLVQVTDISLGRSERVPPQSDKKIEKALDALLQDGFITGIEKAEIVTLIDYRNDVAHRMHDLFADLSPEPFARQVSNFLPETFKKYNYEAVERLQALHRKLEEASLHYITSLTPNSLLFGAAEHVFLSEIEALRRKISRLAKIRKSEIDAVNKQLSLDGSELVGESDPRHPLNRYDDGRLTRRGAEVCYRLFDMGKTPIVVAHMMGLRLSSTTARHRKWKTLGGGNRVKADLSTLPRRKFYRRDDE